MTATSASRTHTLPLSAVIFGLGLSLVAGTACRTGSPPQPVSDAPGAFTGDVTLVVRNPQYDDVRLYLVRSGARIPLGAVSSLESRTLRVDPAALGGRGQFRILLVASRTRARAVGPWIPVLEGAVVEVEVAHDLRFTQFRILRGPGSRGAGSPGPRSGGPTGGAPP